jgi:gliding motility-associated-like protein
LNHPEPIITGLSFDSIVCFGGSNGSIFSTVIGGNQSYNYSWYNASNSLISIKPNLSNINSGTFKLIVKDILNCSDTTSIFIPDGEKYINKAVYNPRNCWGSSFIIQTKDPSTAKWQVPGAIINANKLQINNFSTRDTGTYIVTVLNPKGCLSTDTFYLRPYDYINSVEDTAICEQQPLSIFLKNVKNTEWKLNGRVFEPNILNELWIPYSKIKDSGQYSVKYTTKDNCKDSFHFNLTIHKKIEVQFDSTSAPFQICENQDKTILIKASSSFNGLWKYPDGSTIPVNSNSFIRFSDVRKSQEGLYTLFAFDNNGCADTAKFYLNVGKISPAKMYKNSDINCFFPKGKPFFVNDISVGSRTSNFYLNDSLIAINKISVPLKFEKSGFNRIKLIIKTDDGCIDSAEETLFVNEEPKIYIPNTFTPNNDLLNDIFKPIMNSSVKKYQMSVYNKWGEKLFEEAYYNNSNNLRQGWDGSYLGKPCHEGVYVFILRWNDTCSESDDAYNNNDIKEYVTLIR